MGLQIQKTLVWADGKKKRKIYRRKREDTYFYVTPMGNHKSVNFNDVERACLSAGILPQELPTKD